MHRYATRPGLYFTDDGGADVVVRSETADQVWLCVLEPIDEPSAFFQDAIRLFEDPNISFIQQIHEFPVCTRIIEHLYLRETLFRMTGPNYGLWYVHLPKAWDGMRYGYRVDGAYRFFLDAHFHSEKSRADFIREVSAFGRLTTHQVMEEIQGLHPVDE